LSEKEKESLKRERKEHDVSLSQQPWSFPPLDPLVPILDETPARTTGLLPLSRTNRDNNDEEEREERRENSKTKRVTPQSLVNSERT
jgi:hypothetical protein